jgi:hypothetical protein
MPQLYPLEVHLYEDEIGALDQACEVFGICREHAHAEVIRQCLLYVLLSLREAGMLAFPADATPAFVRQYDELTARLSAADNSAPPASVNPADCSETPRSSY